MGGAPSTGWAEIVSSGDHSPGHDRTLPITTRIAGKRRSTAVLKVELTVPADGDDVERRCDAHLHAHARAHGSELSVE
jgi:hypothetical protein